MHELIAQFVGKIFTLKNKALNKNIRIGNGLRISTSLCIIGKGTILIGDNCRICGMIGEKNQYVLLNTQKPDAIIRIGDNVNLCSCRISSRYSIVVGNNVLIEDSALFDTDFHSIDIPRGNPIHENRKKCAISIGDHVSIGARCLITKGVTIGEHAIIAPGSIVSMPIRPGCLACGNPARMTEDQ